MLFLRLGSALNLLAHLFTTLIHPLFSLVTFPRSRFNPANMKVTLALLACVASAYAQAVPTNAGSMASITDMSAPLSTPAGLASEEAEASCLTGAYVSSRRILGARTLTVPEAPT
jgi:hypothetical protein